MGKSGGTYSLDSKIARQDRDATISLTLQANGCYSLSREFLQSAFKALSTQFAAFFPAPKTAVPLVLPVEATRRQMHRLRRYDHS